MNGRRPTATKGLPFTVGGAWRATAWPLLILLVPALVYLPTLSYPFQYDDFHAIADNPYIRQWRWVPSFFVDPTLFSAQPENAMYRPLLLVTWAINWAVSGPDTWSYHLVNLALHTGCGWLVWRLGLGLFGDRPAAAVAALVFLVAPVNCEAVVYLSSRSETLAAFFVLLGLWLHQRPNSGAKGRIPVLLAFGAGMLTKSTAAVLPVLVILYDLLGTGPERRRDYRLYAGLGVVAAAYVVLGWRLVHRAALGAPVRGYGEQVWTQVKAGVHYLALQIVPVHLTVDHQFLISDTPLDPLVLAAGLLFASLAALAWRVRRERPLALFLLAWWLAALAPASLVPLHVLVNEHRLYLSTAAAALAVGACWQTVAAVGGARQRLLKGMGAVTLMALALLAGQRSRLWANDLALWTDAATKAPLMARPYIFLAEIHAREGRSAAAIEAYAQAIRRDPGFVVGYARMGELQLAAGQAAAARQVLTAGLARTGDHAEIWSQLAEVERSAGRWAACAEALERAVALDPDDPGLRNNLGNAYQMLDRAAEALAQHRQARELDPEDPRTWLNMGNAYLMLAQWAQAEAAYLQATRLDPAYGDAWASLVSLYQRQGRQADAEAVSRQAAAGLASAPAPTRRP